MYYKKVFIKKEGIPEGFGDFETDLGTLFLTVGGMWASKKDPEWWLKLVSGILLTEEELKEKMIEFAYFSSKMVNELNDVDHHYSFEEIYQLYLDAKEDEK